MILYEVLKQLLMLVIIGAILFGSYRLGFACCKEGGFRNYFGFGKDVDDHKVIHFEDLSYKTKKDTLSHK